VPVLRASIAGGGMSARILSWGAVVQDLRLEGHRPPLVLGFERFDDYPARSPYFGAVVGRFANRIAGGRFAIDGEEFVIDRNEHGKHTLHGGRAGTGRRPWRIVDLGPDTVTLGILDPDGWMGFPGNLDVQCTYRLGGSGRLSVEMEASADRTTPCSLAHHSYFNLDDGGAGDILSHRLTIAADRYLPTDDDDIPTGAILPAAGTPHDFRVKRPVGLSGAATIHDHNYCLATVRGPMRPAARLEGARSGIAMAVATTEPGLQFYAGHGIAPGMAGLDGIRYGACSGLCLEPQAWPDAPNRPEFPNALLRPGERYRQRTEYRFERE
jgi:aldose 1-epimerase